MSSAVPLWCLLRKTCCAQPWGEEKGKLILSTGSCPRTTPAESFPPPSLTRLLTSLRRAFSVLLHAQNDRKKPSFEEGLAHSQVIKKNKLWRLDLFAHCPANWSCQCCFWARVPLHCLHFLSVYFFSVYTRSTSVDYGGPSASNF